MTPARLGFVNDATYTVQPTIEGVRVVCPIYRAWSGMAVRCSSVKERARRQTYDGVFCCEEWKLFSIFREWMLSQIWEGLELDKDILVFGNREYGPETCAFVPSYINCLLLGSDAIRGDLPLGVTKVRERYMSQTRTGNERQRVTSYHNTPQAAHKAWQNSKADVIEQAVMKWGDSINEGFRTDVALSLLDRAKNLRHAAINGTITTRV